MNRIALNKFLKHEKNLVKNDVPVSGCLPVDRETLLVYSASKVRLSVFIVSHVTLKSLIIQDSVGYGNDEPFEPEAQFKKR